MRIRVRHIVIIVIVLVTAFILYATSMHQNEEESLDPLSGLAPPINMPMEKAPEIYFDTTTIDLGVIANDKEAHKEVPVYNRGGSVLEITDVRTSCSMCTIGSFENGGNRIQPGESSNLKITVAPRGIHGFHSRKVLTLMCNDPRNPQMELVVEAHVDPEYILEPESFTFGETEKGKPAAISIVLRNCTATAVSVLAVTLAADSTTPEASDNITFQMEEIPEAEWKQAGRKEYRITATLAPEMNAGPFEIPVFIHTDLKRFAIYRVLATGTVVAPYTVELSQPTAALHLKNGAPEVVTLRSDQVFQLKDIRSAQGYFIATEQQEDGGVRFIRCAPKTELERGMHKDSLLFDVVMNDKTYTERIEVTIFAYGLTHTNTKQRDES